MCVDARACVLAGTTTVVARGEADLRISIFVFTSALACASGAAVWIDDGQMVIQSCHAVLGVRLSPDPVVHGFPYLVVASVRIIAWQVVPEQILDVELVIFRKVNVELQDGEIRQIIVVGALSHKR